ncbi:MAG: hypothetical protein WC291_12145, partial [Thermodesulfovibrionales bacterium]
MADIYGPLIQASQNLMNSPYEALKTGVALKGMQNQQALQDVQLQDTLAKQQGMQQAYGVTTPAEAYAAQGKAEIAKQQQEVKSKQMGDLVSAVKAFPILKRTMGAEGIKQNWEAIKGLNPFFAKIDPDKFDATPEGNVIEKDAQGNVLGRWIRTFDAEGKEHVQFVKAEPPITDYQRQSLDLKKQEGEENRALRREINEGNQALREELSR